MQIIQLTLLLSLLFATLLGSYQVLQKLYCYQVAIGEVTQLALLNALDQGSRRASLRHRYHGHCKFLIRGKKESYRVISSKSFRAKLRFDGKI